MANSFGSAGSGEVEKGIFTKFMNKNTCISIIFYCKPILESKSNEEPFFGGASLYSADRKSLFAIWTETALPSTTH